MADGTESKTPAQPSAPPQGTSPSPAHDRASDISWDSWHQHGNFTTAQDAIANRQNKVDVDPSSLKR